MIFASLEAMAAGPRGVNGASAAFHAAAGCDTNFVVVSAKEARDVRESPYNAHFVPTKTARRDSATGTRLAQSSIISRTEDSSTINGWA